MKGIILAGGSGTRLHPLTISTSKQLLPVYDKPMIYYPLSTLMTAGIKEILIISTPEFLPLFIKLLGDGSDFGIDLTYKSQPEPKGIPQAFIIGEDFIGNDPISLILGDNIFYGDNIDFNSNTKNAIIWTTAVKHPNRYGVLEYDNNHKVCSIVEKPETFISKYAVTGLYQYPNDVIGVAKGLKPSSRGELEITSINNHYLQENRLEARFLDRNNVWLDAGTHKSLHHASSYVETIQNRSGIMIGSPEEASYDKGWINEDQLLKLANKYNNEYGVYLRQLVENKRIDLI